MGSIEQVDLRQAPPRFRDVFLFSHVRTASNLLCHLLSTQPGWMQSEYHFQPAFFHARESFNWAPLTEIPGEKRQKFEGMLQQGMDRLQEARDTAVSEGKRLFVKNHTFYVWEPAGLSQSMWGGRKGRPFTVAPSKDTNGTTPELRTNPTVFPDEFLNSWQPVFLIRHPALSFESWYRAEIRIEPIDVRHKSWTYLTTFQYSRQLYDWFVKNEAQDREENGTRKPHPVVIDADDVINRDALPKLCEVCDMDLDYIKFEWKKPRPSNSEERGSRQMSFLGGLWDSTTIDKSKSSQHVNMAVKYEQWKEEFGVVVADTLHARTQKAMPDYEYLRSKKL